MSEGGGVTFETVLKNAKTASWIAIERDRLVDLTPDALGRFEVWKKVGKEQWISAAEVVALQTQLQQWWKRIEEPNIEWANLNKWLEEGRKLLGCMEAKEK